MHVGIDISQSAFTGSGVARYTTSLVHSITELDSKNTYTFLYSSLRRSVPEKIIKAIKKPLRLIRLYMPPTFLSFLGTTFTSYQLKRLLGVLIFFYLPTGPSLLLSGQNL